MNTITEPGYYWMRYDTESAWEIVEARKHDTRGIEIFDTKTNHDRYGPNTLADYGSEAEFVRIEPPSK